MTLGEKLRHLRQVEGALRGLGREMAQVEVAREIRRQGGKGLSQSYLSQIESGARRHLTSESRAQLARFFRVHPGYLVDDPPGYHEGLGSDLREREASMDVWLMQGVERFHRDRALRRALQRLAGQPDSRRWLLLLGDILESPRLAAQFRDAMR